MSEPIFDRGWAACAGAAVLLLAFVIACAEKPVEEPSTSSPPVRWEASARADKREIQVGEALSVAVTVRHPAGAEFVIPTGANLAPFEFIERVDEPSRSPVESRILLRMGAYRLPGDIAVPPIRVEYRKESGEVSAIETPPIPIKLVTSLTPGVTDIHDIKGPIEDLPLPIHWNRLWWLLAALVAALIGYWVYRKLRKRERVTVEAAVLAPAIPPEIEAEQALRNLAEARLLERARVAEFYTALAEIMKRYAGRRFGVAYLERTTTEILADLRGHRLDREDLERLRWILTTADLVKFARIVPVEEESGQMLPEAFRFLEDTRPKPEPPALSPMEEKAGEKAEVRA